LNQISEIDENYNVTPHHDFNPLADEEIDVGVASILSGENNRSGHVTSKTAKAEYHQIKI